MENYEQNTMQYYFQDMMANVNILSSEETKSYFRKINQLKRELDETLDESEKRRIEKTIEYYTKLIIEGNLDLVCYIAIKYKEQGLDLEDLVQEGNLGLMMAVEAYKTRATAGFEKMAIQYIENRMTTAIEKKKKIIKLPTSIIKKIDTLSEMTEEYNRVYKRKPTMVEYSKKVHEDPMAINQLFYAKALEQADGLENGVNFDELAQESVSLEDAFIAKEAKSYIDDAIRCILSEKEEFVIRMHFGISDGKNPLFTRTHSHEEIAKILNVSTTRIGQYEEKAFRKLRKPSSKVAINRIRDYYFENAEIADSYRFIQYFNKDEEILAMQEVQNLSGPFRDAIYMVYGSNLSELNSCDLETQYLAFSGIRLIQNKLKEKRQFIESCIIDLEDVPVKR